MHQNEHRPSVTALSKNRPDHHAADHDLGAAAPASVDDPRRRRLLQCPQRRPRWLVRYDPARAGPGADLPRNGSASQVRPCAVFEVPQASAGGPVRSRRIRRTPRRVRGLDGGLRSGASALCFAASRRKLLSRRNKEVWKTSV